VTEPIRRVEGPRGGLSPAAAAGRVRRVEREDAREEEEPRRRRARPERRPAPGAGDGHPHVDVQA
jgi:hypothetical protein